MAEHNEIGKKGEGIALNYLKSKGFVILEKNWRFKYLEVDIIAQKDSLLVFIEVKTRKSNHFGEPETFVDIKKQKHLKLAANEYIDSKKIELEARFDIISIIIDNDKNVIKHIEDAFLYAH